MVYMHDGVIANGHKKGATGPLSLAKCAHLRKRCFPVNDYGSSGQARGVNVVRPN